MPRPLFTANRQSANTLIWRRFDPFRPYRLLLWLIAAPLGYSYSVALLQPLFRDSAWFAWYPLMYTLALALICHRSLIRLLWNPPILVCDEHGLTAYNEYGRWLGQWQWAQIAELRVVQQADDNLALEVIMHGERPQPPASPAAVQRTLASYGTTYLPAADSPAEAPRELLPLPELGPDLLLVPGEIRRHRARATLDSPRSETRAWYKHPRAIQLDNWRCFTWLAATLVSVPLLLGIATRSGFNDQPAALCLLTCASLLLQQSWRAFRRLIADPARPVARIDGEGIRIDDGATRLHMPWRDLRRIENDDGVLVLTDYRDRHYRTLRAAGNDDRSLDAIITASRAMRDGEPLPDDTPLPPPRRRPLAWLLLANSLLLPASLTLLYLSRAPRETGLTLLALLAIAALAWWARQSHWQTQATYREPLPATPPAPRPDLPVRQWYRHPRAIARANWLAWWLLLPASLLAMRASDALPANIRLTLAILSALLALGAARLLWHTFAHADRPVARSDRDGLHLALTNPRQRDFHRILLYGTLGGSKLNFTIPWAELDDIDTAWRQNHKALTLSDPNGDQRAIRCHAVGGETIARGIARVVHAYKTHLDALADPIDYSDPEYLHFMERTLRGELPDDLDPDSELAQELRQILQATQPPPDIAEDILADIARRRAARSAKSIPPTHSQPPRIRPRAWWLLAANLAVAIALPALKALDSGIPAFWPFAVLTVLNLAAWRGDYRQQAVMQEERRPAPAATRPRHSVRNWYKPAHLVARANGRACARLFLLAMLGVPLANALAKHHTFFSLCLAIPAVLIARALWSELRYTFSQSDQPVARIDADGLHLAVRGNRLHAGAPNLHIPWDDLAAINAVPYDAPPWWFTTHEHLAIQTSSGDDYRIRTALLDDFASVQDIAHSASSNRTSSENRPRVAPPPPALPTAFARGLMVANLASVALWLIANLLLQHHLITLPYTEPPLPYDSYPLLNLLRILPFGAYPLTNAACWITFATVNIVARLLPAEWHTRPIMPAPEATATAMPVIHRNISCL